ncbi:MAG: HAMP domain-containing histidine kinase [Bacteroidaceae bacterium]|nr:HAMP domain-containing histidine kinase [Bacteroidaceae bacterium]
MKLFGNDSTKRLRRMLEAIRTRDFTLQYSTEKLSGEDKLLAEEINSVINEFRDTISQQESQYQYFDTLLNTVNAFLIVTNEEHSVKWMNRPAIEGLCGFKINNIDDLGSLSPTLPQQLYELKPGTQKLIKFTSISEIGKMEQEYATTVVHFYNQGFCYRLYSMQNVKRVIQQSETETQQRLVSVLTHEIMNSLTPIISLSDTLRDGMKDNTLEQDDIMMAVQAIHRRSSGLLSFVENYRKLQKLSAPQKSDITVGTLIKDIQGLFSTPEFHFEVDDESLVITIDRTQIEQMLINLLKNAKEACEQQHNPMICLRVSAQNHKREVLFSISDNGEGILPEVQERIFTPFFTTKQGGSGIGLSICKQIVTLHEGTINVSSDIGKGTRFDIILPTR